MESQQISGAFRAAPRAGLAWNPIPGQGTTVRGGFVQREIEGTRQEPVPLHLRNAPTKLMKQLDYGKGYRYAHNEEGKVAEMDCLPESLKGRSYYHPTQEGREKLLAQRMEEIRRIKQEKRQKSH